jgi:hypothetical protein
MKKLILCAIFLLPFNSQACPDLTGEYYCLIENGPREDYLDILKINQTTETNITTFISSYRSVPGYQEVFSADDTGIADGMGWIVKCRADRVVSVRNDFSAYSELYLDKDDRLVRTYNYNVQQVCSRKK